MASEANGQIDVLFTDEERKELIELVTKIVEIPSPSSHEDLLAEFIERVCREIGFPDVRIDEAGSVIAILRKGDGPTLLFDAHLDTAKPVTDIIAEASSEMVTFDDDLIYGLGTCEGKSSIASLLMGLKKFIAEASFSGTLVAVFLVLGNFCEGGSLKLILENEGITPDAVILGEPSDLRVIRGHRGRTHFEVTIRGKSCHSATPHLGKNAIMAASRLLFSIDLIAADLLEDPFLGPGTIAVTSISSEAPALNSLPHTCKIAIDRRLTVGETMNRARSEIEMAIIRENIDASIQTAQFEARSYTGYVFNREGAFDAWSLAEEHPLVEKTLDIIRDLIPEKATAVSSTFSTDGAYSMVEREIPTIGFGPGNAALVHTNEEKVRIKDLLIASLVYHRIAKQILGTVEAG